ncbi:MAG: signal peptidase I [Erysipelotrichaceae bacterium]|nr:signal peptidase I [Erysipelotrichaceae bacterium]
MPLKDNKKTGGRSSVFLHITGYIFITVFFLVVGFLLIPKLIGYKTYDIISASMEPEIPVHSLVYVKEVDPFELEEGDIITFNYYDAIVTHRIVNNDKEEQVLRTKGDMNEIEDMRDTVYDDVIGKVTYHIPYLGLLGAYLDSFIAKIILVIFGLVGLIMTGI